jgi:hypothetical protein
VTVYAEGVSTTDAAASAAEAAEVRVADAARRRRDRELSMAERLERVHELCAQMSRLAPIALKHPS